MDQQLDPKTETGLLLTLTLIVLVVGGFVLGVLGLLVRVELEPLAHRPIGRTVG